MAVPESANNEPARQGAIARALAIVNPAAGAQSGPLVAQWLREAAGARGVDLVVRETTPEGEPRELARDADQFDRVIASGGDGTLMHVLSGIAMRGVPLSLIPAGTGNVLVKALGLPLDLRRACDAALGPAELTPIDLGVVDGKLYFALRVSVGYEARVIRDTTRSLKSSFGRLAYGIQAGRHALQLQPVHYKLDVDGQSIERDAVNLWVANSGTLGVMGMGLDPRIRIDDGRLDLCAITVDLNAVHHAPLAIVKLLQQSELPDTIINHIPVHDRVRIEAWPPQPVQADGDLIGETPCEIGVAPRAVSICFPVR